MRAEGRGGHTRHSSTMNVDIICGVSFLSLPLPPPPYESTTSSIKHTGVRHKRACVSLLLLGVTLGGHLEALAVRLAGWPVERELVERVFAPCSKVGLLADCTERVEQAAALGKSCNGKEKLYF